MESIGDEMAPLGETRGRRASTDTLLMQSTETMALNDEEAEPVPMPKKRASETDFSEVRSLRAKSENVSLNESRSAPESPMDEEPSAVDEPDPAPVTVAETPKPVESTPDPILATPIESTPGPILAAASKFRAAAKVVTTSTAAARVHRTRRLSAGDAATHSIAEDECIAFIDFINARLADDADVQHLLPIEAVDELWTAVGDGILLCKLINVAAADSIDRRAVNMPKGGAVSAFHTIENQNLALNAAKAIGIKVINVGSQDMVEGKPHLVLGLVWQLVKMSLLAKISLKENPFLVRLLQEGETLEQLLKLTPEELLTRWVNHHLAASGCARRLQNFGPDLRDSEIYTHLLSQIDPQKKATTRVLADTKDVLRRAEYVVAQGARLGAEFQVRPQDIVKANDKLNLGFLAALFNQCPGLDPPDAAELRLFDELAEDDVGDSREERAFRNWINSLGLDGAHCGNLFDDMRDGVLLLKTMGHVKPGLVEMRRVNLAPKTVFKKVENTNYAIELATSRTLHFSLVGVQGKDLTDGNKKLTLALIWQLMRTHLTDFLASLRAGGGGSAAVSDAEMVRWATSRVHASGRGGAMRDFADKTLGSGVFLLDLLAAVEPRCVNRELVAAGATEEEQMLNARYAIACARKLNCAIFCLPEDIVEVKPKMILAFIASVMAFDLQQQKAPPA